MMSPSGICRGCLGTFSCGSDPLDTALTNRVGATSFDSLDLEYNLAT